eukprot:8783706-Lingulodinium_polyedra.AAC.1
MPMPINAMTMPINANKAIQCHPFNADNNMPFNATPFQCECQSMPMPMPMPWCRNGSHFAR